ncbi:cytochrome d ubiquinol oxidase subunit II [Lutibacter oceani]|uniref:Cytochrome d ubiquinol oxidase subunit II n=1 Tax=Lutibacter oceani TaxID=1853311 RepID=A0A3D9RMI6_9FLAO|nr:cytochrome d ubiquinol oxidase subunit II [Lutibacter oceani]REE80798.1 cytochrome d ubiquinol oxidase subunit II [Lutibacter oceani]
MELTWYIILCFMLVMYIVLDGFDFGAGIIHLFFAKTEEEKKQVMRAIGPFWDGNEVWLIAAGGVLFASFPTLYASAFSGFYLPLIMILWFFIFRALGIEFTHLINHELWIKPWEKSFGISSLLLALFFGVAFGNIIRGVNLGGVENNIAQFSNNYSFFTPLWDGSFSPFAERPGVIDWFTITIGLVAVLTLTIHGANWIILKTEGAFVKKLQAKILPLWIALVVLILISLIAFMALKSFNKEIFTQHPTIYLLPFIAFISLFGMLLASKSTKNWVGFASSTLFIISGIGSAVASLFPVVIPSTNSIIESLTIYSTSAETYGLKVGLVWWIIAFVLILVYFTFVHRVYKGKLTEKHDHY